MPQAQVLDEYLDALARTAATAPGLTAQETLDQRGRRGCIDTLRGKKGEIKKFNVTLPEDVVSRYALAEIGEGHVLHEIRQLEGAATDFGQLILLSNKRLQKVTISKTSGFPD